MVRKHKKGHSQVNSKFLLTAFLCWALPMAWVAAIPRNTNSWHEKKFTKKVIKNGKNIINQFIKLYGTPPRNLSEIRAYSRITKKTFLPWDAYGQRLDYLSFGKDQWFLRSFGKDAHQNTLMTTQDPVASNLNKMTGLGVQHSFNNESVRYNPIILGGSNSTQGDWFARLYQDHITGSSKLLVRHKIKSNYFMLAKHNTVEEFYWLPDGYRVIYSATSSNRYKDGIYLWNLLSDETIQIFPAKGKLQSATFTSKNNFFNITLAGISSSPPGLMAFIKPKDQNPLDPEKYFSLENFYLFKLPVNGDFSIKHGSDIEELLNPEQEDSWKTITGLKDCQVASKKQIEWCKLPVKGDRTEIISLWQAHAEKSYDMPHFPYVLWDLVKYYEETYSYMNQMELAKEDIDEVAKEAEIIRSFGLEIATALVNLPIAPSWIRSAALSSQYNFINNIPLQFSEPVQMDESISTEKAKKDNIEKIE